MTITVEKYIAALKTWCHVAKRPDEESEEIFRACAALRWKFPKGTTKEPDVFCAFMQKCGRYSIDLFKSNLLYRLIYAQDPLRTRPCPKHQGRWSGCTVEPCPHGCSFGTDVTGWLPEPESQTLAELKKRSIASAKAMGEDVKRMFTFPRANR